MSWVMSNATIQKKASKAAVEQAISERDSVALAIGINVNITLLFAVDSYIKTAEAYMGGLEKRAAKGDSDSMALAIDLSKIASGASFFLSRIDTKVDAKLKRGIDDIAHEAKLPAVQGKVAIANAKIAYHRIQKNYSKPEMASLSSQRSECTAITLGQYQHQRPQIQ